MKTNQKQNEARKLAASGESAAGIARELNVSASTVRRWLKEVEEPPSNAGAPETALAVLPALSGPVKPRKADVIEALVERARVKWEAEREAARKRRQELLRLLNEGAVKEIRARRFRDVSYAAESNNGISFRVTVSNPRLDEMNAELVSVPEYWRSFPEEETRKKIRDGLNATGAKRLLSDPETVKALDGILEKLADKEEGGK